MFNKSKHKDVAKTFYRFQKKDYRNESLYPSLILYCEDLRFIAFKKNIYIIVVSLKSWTTNLAKAHRDSE